MLLPTVFGLNCIALFVHLFSSAFVLCLCVNVYHVVALVCHVPRPVLGFVLLRYVTCLHIASIVRVVLHYMSCIYLCATLGATLDAVLCLTCMTFKSGPSCTHEGSVEVQLCTIRRYNWVLYITQGSRTVVLYDVYCYCLKSTVLLMCNSSKSDTSTQLARREK